MPRPFVWNIHTHHKSDEICQTKSQSGGTFQVISPPIICLQILDAHVFTRNLLTNINAKTLFLFFYANTQLGGVNFATNVWLFKENWFSCTAGGKKVVTWKLWWPDLPLFLGVSGRNKFWPFWPRHNFSSSCQNNARQPAKHFVETKPGIRTLLGAWFLQARTNAKKGPVHPWNLLALT